jgi:hypothetical protein
MSKAVPDGSDGKIMHATGSLYLYVPDFWGDRFGAVDDPSGHRWGLATHVEDPTPEQMAQRQKEFFASMAKK